MATVLPLSGKIAILSSWVSNLSFWGVHIRHVGTWTILKLFNGEKDAELPKALD